MAEAKQAFEVRDMCLVSMFHAGNDNTFSKLLPSFFNPFQKLPRFQLLLCIADSAALFTRARFLHSTKVVSEYSFFDFFSPDR